MSHPQSAYVMTLVAKALHKRLEQGTCYQDLALYIHSFDKARHDPDLLLVCQNEAGEETKVLNLNIPSNMPGHEADL